LQVDSCNAGNQNFATEYAAIGAALNKTGRPVYYSMCYGAGVTIASVGRTLGNEWRIAEDDGSGMPAVVVNIETDATLGQYAGCVRTPTGGLDCGFNDPGLLLVGDLTEPQSRSQMALWSVLMAKLLLSVNPFTLPPWAMSILSNSEVIAVDQDPLTVQGFRVSPPAVEGAIVRNPVTTFLPNPHLGNLPTAFHHKYDVVRQAHERSLGREPQRPPRAFSVSLSQSEVWARKLFDGSVAVAFFNNNGTAPASITCDAACWTAIGFQANQTVQVRDLWAHTNNGTASGSFTAQNVAIDDTAFVRFIPQ
jgi:Alpha galactosidase A/Alpha galactosidase C-terminal beta sandwich domain